MFLVFYFSYINLDVIWHKIQILCQIFYFILFLFYFILFYFILFYFILFYFYFILFYFILFYFILFYFILFYFILFYFILFYFILFFIFYIFILFYWCPVFHTIKDHTRQSWIKEFQYLETLFHWAVSYILQSLVTEANFYVFPICTFTTKTC